MRTATISVRTEPETKKKVTAILKNYGISPSKAVDIFFHGVIIHGGIPFELKVPNAATMRAIRDVEDKKNIETADSIDEVFKKLDI